MKFETIHIYIVSDHKIGHYIYLYSVHFYDQHYLFAKRSWGFKNSSVIMFWAKICQK